MKNKLNTYSRAGHIRASFFLCLFMILWLSGCQDNEVKPLFDKSPSERIQQSIKSVRDMLKASEHGWKISYKPSRTETGYYQFVFRFLKDSVVEVSSDFSQVDLVPVRASYDVLQGSTTKLSFSTFSALHKLSDSEFSPIPGERGAGLKGGFEFLYYGTNDAGDMIFRTNRTEDTVIFHKATAASVGELATSFANRARLLAGKSVYRALVETRNGVEVRSAFGLPYDARVIRIQPVIEEEQDGATVKVLGNSYLIGYGLTPQGILLDSVVLSTGRTVKNIALAYNETESRFETQLGDGTSLYIGDADGPVIPADGQKIFLDPTLTVSLQHIGNDEDLRRTGLTSPAFNQFYSRFNSQIGLGTTLVFNMNVLFQGQVVDYANFVGSASVINANVRDLLLFEDKGDRLVMTRNGFRDANSTVKPENEAVYNEFINFLTDPEGFYVENQGRATRFTNLIFTFTSVKDPSMRFALYHVAP